MLALSNRKEIHSWVLVGPSAKDNDIIVSLKDDHKINEQKQTTITNRSF